MWIIGGGIIWAALSLWGLAMTKSGDDNTQDDKWDHDPRGRKWGLWEKRT